jgi:hypothetical protein
MSSKAYKNLSGRMKDIEQLLEAHKALTQFKRARKAAEEAGGGLAQISEVIDRLVTEPGRGRRTEVDALNRAAMVLLSAHLQGYIEDVFSEAAKAMLDGKVKDVDALIEQALSGFSNPHAYRVDSLFASIGLPKITDGLSWGRASNQTVKRRLTDYIRVRNSIAHGSQEGITKPKVVGFKRFVEVFAKNFDEKVGSEVRHTVEKVPW